MIGLIPPTVAVMQSGVITPAETVWWSQEVTIVVISAVMTGLLLGLVRDMAEAV
jgi:putative effector of murein hydrolase LrgA (UPF0299 family)